MTDETNVEPTAPETPEEETPEVPLPPFYKRFVDVFFNPSRLGAALKEHPKWGVAMLTGIVLVTVMTALIPSEVWQEMQRQTLLRSGQNVTDVPASAQAIVNVTRYLTGLIGIPISEFIFAGIVMLIFAFIMGDEGKYRQYLAMVSHAWLVTVTVELLLVPLKIAQSNPQATVSVGSFFFFLPQGYLLKALSLLAFSKLWTSLVLAAGVQHLSPKRTFASAATILIGINVISAFLFALLPGTG